jgi:hypothetical protein
VILDAGRFVALVRMSEVAIHNSPGNAGNPEIAENAGNGKRQTPNAKRIPVSTKERSLFLLLITSHGFLRVPGVPGAIKRLQLLPLRRCPLLEQEEVNER